MTRARRELAEVMPTQHVVVEVLDARLPASSENPLIAEVRGARPVIKVLTRADLADEALTRAWVRALEQRPGTRAFASTSAEPAATRKRLTSVLRELGLRAGPDKPVRALVCGVPNVGKSTLLNILAGEPVAKVSDKPAVTQRQQHVTVERGLIVTDTPGLTWPKIEDEAGAFRLALVGSIPPTAIDFATIALFGVGQLRGRYAGLLTARYKLPALPAGDEAVLVEIGRRRGALRPGGVVDLHKAAEVFIHDLRAGALGRFTLEEPPAPKEPAAPAPAAGGEPC